jgi:hypothetical protein
VGSAKTGLREASSSRNPRVLPGIMRNTQSYPICDLRE